jgi:uncharacterized protein YdaU (DUF1376 family)
MATGKTDAWYPMYPADYLKDTLALTLEEDGFYKRALDQVYINKGRIPADPGALQRLLRVSPSQFKRCASILAKYFYRDGDGYRNRRADIEIARAQGRAEVARENGKRGGGRPRNNPAETQRVISGLPGNNPAGYPEGGAKGNPEKNSPQSQSDPPFNSPLPEENPAGFQASAPTLYAALGIETPSIREEAAAFEAWAELRAKGATAADFAARAARYREKWPDMSCTFRAVLNNWSQMAPKPKRGPVVPVVEYVPDSLLEDADG